MRITVVLVCFVAAIALGAAACSRGGGKATASPTSTSSGSAAALLQRSGAASIEAFAALGPNTMLHGKAITYGERRVGNSSSFALPNTTIGETYWAFGPDGKLSGYLATTRGTDGTLYQYVKMVDDGMVTTDVKSGETISNPHSLASVTADGLRGAWSRTVTPLIAELAPTAMPTTTSVNGVNAFLIETPVRGTTHSRIYLSQTDYSLVRSETLAADGHIVSYDQPLVQEVLSGNAIPPFTP